MDELTMLRETADAILSGRSSNATRADPMNTTDALWEDLVRSGLTGVGVPEELGGSGAGTREAAELVLAVGRSGIATPLADATFVGGWLCGQIDQPFEERPVVAADAPGLRAAVEGDEIVLTGAIHHVPWGRAAGTILVLPSAIDGVVVIPGTLTTIDHATNLVSEPRDTLRFDATRLPVSAVIAVDDAAVLRVALARRTALCRALLLAGALETITESTIAYVREREQFGRPIASFQAVRQATAVLAGHAALATTAARAAALTPDHPIAVMSARVAVAEATSAGAAIAHQLHGAIGLTREHHLHRSTMRVWAWRDEGGTERTWRGTLGREVADRAADGVWPTITE